MPQFCAAVGCSNASNKAVCQDKKVSFHGFPLKNTSVLKEWLHKMKRKGFTPNMYSKICSEHFDDECFDFQPFTNRRGLKPGAVPTKFAHTKEENPNRQRTSYELRPAYTNPEAESMNVNVSEATQTEPGVISSLLEKLSIAQTEINVLKMESFCLGTARKDEHIFNSITGFSPSVFDTVFNFLNVQDINSRAVRPVEQFFIFLVRLKSGVTVEFLSVIFHIPKSSISRILVDMTEYLYMKFKQVDIWPSREQIHEYMPEAFIRCYPNCRVILDCTEIGIQKPSNPRIQQLTFSYYKNKNTLKALIVITPSGAISFISDLWCGGI